jgi:uracil-DNA glycosylase
MPYIFPFGETVKPLVQEDRTPKKVFVLGVYASAVHARWMNGASKKCNALAVASEPRIFWDGNPKEAAEIISRIIIPKELGTLEPADERFNGPSAKVLDEHILAPLGFTRKDAWLCDLLPETRLNKGQVNAIKEYDKYRKEYGLNEVTIPERPSKFCDNKRCEEIVAELEESKADLLVLLGDIPIKQFLNKVANVGYKSLQEYTDLYGYGNPTEAIINGRTIKVLPFAHPRQIGALGHHSNKWFHAHQKFLKQGKNYEL